VLNSNSADHYGSRSPDRQFVMLKVLLVEDNPMVMELLRDAIAPLATVVCVADAADALLHTVEDPPDLIITDYQMPGMDGRQLLDKLRARKATAQIPVMLMASKSDIVERLKPLEEDVVDFICKPFFVKDAVLRVKRALARVSLEKMSLEATSGSKVSGSLTQMNVIDLLQSLEMGRKTCSLKLTNGEDNCSLFFTEGQITDANYDDLNGDPAVYKVLTWAGSGQFEMDFNGRSSGQTTTRSTQGLLMEGLRLLDESTRDAEER
jgi:CheY-like chemotaxis protein